MTKKELRVFRRLYDAVFGFVDLDAVHQCVGEAMNVAAKLLSELDANAKKESKEDESEAENVHNIWSDAVADLCLKIGVDPRSFDWSPAETTEETVWMIIGEIIEKLPKPRPVDEIIQAVAELSNRTSPGDWPEAMLVTADELRKLLTQRW